jgi:hypothetical protein
VTEILPLDTETTKYVPSSWEEELRLYEILDWCEHFFPGVDPRDITVSHEEIQVKCFGYDLYDRDDYRHYWVFRRI